MTDITGFGLAGHALELAKLSQVDFAIDFGRIALLPGAEAYARQNIFPGGMGRNRDYFSQWLRGGAALPDYAAGLLYDPQTSGGLLMAVAAEAAPALLAALLGRGETAFELGEVLPGAGELVVG